MVDSLTIINRWSDENLEGAWPTAPFTELNKNQKYFVEVNAETLCNKKQWDEVLEKFQEMMLEVFHADGTQEEVRDKYTIRFSNFDFTGKNTNFTDYVFPCNVDFCGVKFGNENVSFRNAKFMGKHNDFSFVEFGDGDVDFYGVKFGEGDVNFLNASFGNGEVNFRKAIFEKGNINFGNVKFREGNVNFSNASFGNGDIFFMWTNFGEGDVNFNESTFGEGDVVFLKAEFGEGDVSFKETKFGEGDINFRNANFGDGTVQFDGAVFGKGNTSFRRAKFGKGGVDFDGVNFGEGNVIFVGTEFSGGEVRFNDTEIRKGFFNFYPSEFKKTSFDGSGMIVDGSLILRGKFDEEFSLAGSTITNTTTLHDVEFAKVPDFRDASFGRAPEVSNIKILLSDSDKKSRWSWRPFEHSENSDDASKFRKLKVMAIDNYNHEESLKYFAHEMMAKHGNMTNDRLGRAVNFFYYVVSNYGQSIGRPLIGLIGTFIFFTIFYFFLTECSPNRWCAMGNALLISLHNSFPFLGNMEPSTNMGLSIFQKISSSIFLFFILLAFRNKFRIK